VAIVEKVAQENLLYVNTDQELLVAVDRLSLFGVVQLLTLLCPIIQLYLKMFFCWLAIWLPIFFLFYSMNELELGAGIDPGMALTLTISI
jgi:hypothetical protein